MNTDDYEGHTIDDMTHSQAGENLWFLEQGSNFMTMNRATLDLIKDSPDLLREVMRLKCLVSNIVRCGGITDGAGRRIPLSALNGPLTDSEIAALLEYGCGHLFEDDWREVA